VSARPAIFLDEDTHTYSVDGRVVPGVTRVLEPLCSWEHVPPDVLERKGQLGTAVHLATHFDDKGTLDEASLSDEVLGYVEAWRRFRREKRPTILLSERKVFHESPAFAGTLDREMALEGELTIGDIKSGVKHRVHGVQLAAYALARKHEAGWATFPRRLGIYLAPDGRYELELYTRANDYPMFLSMLNLANWRATP
jgi:hypothetical protein